MSDYSEEDWRKWQFAKDAGWYLEESYMDGAALFCIGHDKTDGTNIILIIEPSLRKAIDSPLSAKDSLIAELTKEREDLRSKLADLSQPPHPR